MSVELRTGLGYHSRGLFRVTKKRQNYIEPQLFATDGLTISPYYAILENDTKYPSMKEVTIDGGSKYPKTHTFDHFGRFYALHNGGLLWVTPKPGLV